jgi:hypothetical protein
VLPCGCNFTRLGAKAVECTFRTVVCGKSSPLLRAYLGKTDEAVSILVLLVLLQTPAPTAEAAAALALGGDLDGCERALDVRARPDEPATLFVRACVRLERGEVDAATAVISRGHLINA